MVKTINIDEIQQKLFISLKDSGWSNLLKSFLLSYDFTLILEALYQETTEQRRFTPGIKDIFRPFIECPYSELHTVIITRESFCDFGISSGIPFDCSNAKTEHYSTKCLLDEVERTVYKDEFYEHETNFTHWCNQGILMLNTTLTTQLHKEGKHEQIWQPFTAFLLDTLNIQNKGLIFVFMGDEVKKYASMIDKNVHYKYAASHPSTAAKNQGIWDSEDIFNKVSKLVQNNYGKKIIW
jgi:uracil-DNA glycosylase